MGLDYKIIKTWKTVPLEAFSPEMQEVIGFWRGQGDYYITNGD